jgi:hypothetical protein
MSDEKEKNELAEFIEEALELREAGYTSAEIRALLSSDQWMGNARRWPDGEGTE